MLCPAELQGRRVTNRIRTGTKGSTIPRANRYTMATVNKTLGASRNRTGGLLAASQTLSRLSYSPRHIGVTGLEPALTCTQNTCPTTGRHPVTSRQGLRVGNGPFGPVFGIGKEITNLLRPTRLWRELNPPRPCLTSRRPRRWTSEAKTHALPWYRSRPFSFSERRFHLVSLKGESQYRLPTHACLVRFPRQPQA